MAVTTQNYRAKSEVKLDVARGETDIDVSAADYTSYQALLTIAPPTGEVLTDVEIVFDLAKATTGFAAGHTSQTITFAVQRKVDGTNWRTDLASQSTAVSGTNSAAAAQRLVLGTVGPQEQARIVVKLSAENAVDVELPYALTYRGERPTITEVAA